MGFNTVYFTSTWGNGVKLALVANDFYKDQKWILLLAY